MNDSDIQNKISELNAQTGKMSSDFTILEGYIKHISFIKSQIAIHGLQSKDVDEILALHEDLKSVYFKCKNTLQLIDNNVKSLPLDVLHSNKSIMIYSPQYILKVLETCHKNSFYVIVTKITKINHSKYRKSVKRKFLEQMSNLLSLIFNSDSKEAFHVFYENSYKLVTVIEALEYTRSEDIKLMKQYKGETSRKDSESIFYDKIDDNNYINTETQVSLVESKELLISLLQRENKNNIGL